MKPLTLFAALLISLTAVLFGQMPQPTRLTTENLSLTPTSPVSPAPDEAGAASLQPGLPIPPPEVTMPLLGWTVSPEDGALFGPIPSACG